MMRSAQPNSRRVCRQRGPCHRRGSTYAAVLGTSLVVMTISAGALQIVHVQSQSGTTRDDMAEARLFAASAVEWGRRQIAQDVNWRSTFSNGAWATNRSIGNTTVAPVSQGKFSLSVVNPSGALNRSELDSIVMTATGASGGATQKAQVTLDAKKVPYSCLSAAVSAAGSIDWTSSKVFGSNQLIASNGNVIANGMGSARIYPNVEATGSITGGRYYGSAQETAKPKSYPTSKAFDYYIANGTAIPFTSIPMISGTRRMSNKFILGWYEPFTGRSNSQGIFVVDCGGNNLIIEDCFVMATIVLLNAGSGTTVRGDTNWYTTVSNLPCLMVQGRLLLATKSSNSGNPQAIYGLIYVSGDVSLDDKPAVDLLVAGGSLVSNNADLTLSYRSTFFDNPPPGFYTVDMVVSRGSWKQNVD
jgi:hypothetical protein